jgi:hypothetical protein
MKDATFKLLGTCDVTKKKKKNYEARVFTRDRRINAFFIVETKAVIDLATSKPIS